MTRHDGLVAALETWFDAEAAAPAPRPLFAAVVARTAILRPRSRWRARIGGDGLRRSHDPQRRRRTLSMALGAVTLLSVAALAVVGSGMRGLLWVMPSPSTHQATQLQPTVAPDGSPPVEPRLSPSDARRLAIERWQEEAVGVVREPERVTKVEFLPASVFYPHETGGHELAARTWVVEADQSSFVSCGSECFVLDRATTFIEDATGMPTGNSYSGQSMPLPSAPFRRALADNSLAYSPREAPSDGIVDKDTVVAGLDPRAFAIKPRMLVGPLYGVVSVVESDSGQPLPISPFKAGNRAIWWLQVYWTTEIGPGRTGLSDGPWVAVDALTGAVLMQG